jgi:hypothetical protein
LVKDNYLHNCLYRCTAARLPPGGRDWFSPCRKEGVAQAVVYLPSMREFKPHYHQKKAKKKELKVMSSEKCQNEKCIYLMISLTCGIQT